MARRDEVARTEPDLTSDLDAELLASLSAAPGQSDSGSSR